MKDQFGNDVPNDLVILENEAVEHLDPDEIEAINNLDWYEVLNCSAILVSFDKLEQVVELPFFVVEPEEIDLELKEVNYINRNLHRYNTKDGWYHA